MAAKKKPSQGALTRKCDRLFSLAIRQRDGKCQNCGTDQNLQCAHGFSRRYFATRWELWNAFALCRDCHVYYTHRPLEWEEWLQERWGLDDYWANRRLAINANGYRPDKEALAAYFARGLAA